MFFSFHSFPSWEGQGVGQVIQSRLPHTHPLPLPRGEFAVDLSNRLRKSCSIITAFYFS